MRFRKILGALAVCAACVAPTPFHPPATAAANPTALAPQFTKWAIPVYSSHVKSATTYAPTSYGIATTDLPPIVVAWYRNKLKARVLEPHQSFAWPKEFIVDSGTYVIHFNKDTIGKDTIGTTINVIKN